MPRLRVLLVADTHLGFDLPLRPRVERRRRGPDFFANFDRAGFVSGLPVDDGPILRVGLDFASSGEER